MGRDSGRTSIFREAMGPFPRSENYLYDPLDPVPTLVGCTAYIPNDAFDQRAIERRCLIYASGPLRRDLTIIGNLRHLIYAKSSVPDTLLGWSA